jgi:tetratricopeptide (TPR) repeat protein
VRKLESDLAELRAARQAAEEASGDRQVRDAAEKLGDLAAVLFGRGEYPVARSVGLTAVELGAQTPLLFYQLGYCEAVRGDNEAACKAYGAAVDALNDQAPGDNDLLVKALNNWGAAAASAGRPAEAEKLYLRALAVDRTYTPTWFNLGLLCAGDPARKEEAVEAFRKHITHGGARSATARRKLRELLGEAADEDAGG